MSRSTLKSIHHIAVLRVALSLGLCLVVATLSNPVLVTAEKSSDNFVLDEPVVSVPIGGSVTFDNTVEVMNSTTGEVPVFIRKVNSVDVRVWQVTGAMTMIDNTHGEVGFVVPQLERGRYEAWHGAATTDRMIFDAVPFLNAEDGIRRGKPGSTVEFRVRIYSPTIYRKDQATAEPVRVSVTLNSDKPDIAVPSSPRTVTTDANGYASWKIEIKGLGIASLTASAEGFESATSEIVGMPIEAATYSEAVLSVLNERAKKSELALAEARDEIGDRAARTAAVVRDRDRDRDVERKRSEVGGRVGAVIDRNESASSAQAAYLGALQNKAVAERAAVEQWAHNMEATQPRSIAEKDLKPGDVLLVLGSSFVSAAIRSFEERQLGGTASYSHASLYLGEINGMKMVGEMWPTGFWITPLNISVRGSRIVDVYRCPLVGDSNRQDLARRAASLFGETSKFVRYDNPSFVSQGSLLPYAFEEIALLAIASAGSPGFLITTTISHIVDPRAGGRRKMICSEYVAWSYHDSGVDLDVPYWKTLVDLNVFTNDDRRRDYTTPNMIARSKNLSLIGRYLGA